MGTGEQRRALLLVALAAVLANASWFSATAVVPVLEHDWHLTSAGAAWLVIMVQIGFVVGSVGAALLNLLDRIEPRWLIAGSAVAAGTANLGLLLASGHAVALPVRFLVGVALAGVYAPAVRLVATHFERGRGVATGLALRPAAARRRSAPGNGRHAAAAPAAGSTTPRQRETVAKRRTSGPCHAGPVCANRKRVAPRSSL